MIKVQRGVEPIILSRKKNAWTLALLNATTKEARKKAECKYGHPNIKKALVALFHGKCAYCESNIVHVDYGHIDHFRPKSILQFKQLTFEWKNLFLACGKCNGAEYKSDRFPDQTEGGPPINPCDDTPEVPLEFLFDITSRLATVSFKTERGRVSSDLFGLNRPDLRTHRSQTVEKLLVLARFAATDQEALQLLQQSQSDEAEYSAFARGITI